MTSIGSMFEALPAVLVNLAKGQSTAAFVINGTRLRLCEGYEKVGAYTGAARAFEHGEQETGTFPRVVVFVFVYAFTRQWLCFRQRLKYVFDAVFRTHLFFFFLFSVVCTTHQFTPPNGLAPYFHDHVLKARIISPINSSGKCQL